MTIQEMNMLDLNEIRKNIKSNELILDVRTPEEFSGGHVPGSRNIPHDTVGSHASELKNYARIYIHCQAGGRAGRAAEALTQQGLTNIVCISGSGMGDWMAAGLPVER